MSPVRTIGPLGGSNRDGLGERRLDRAVILGALVVSVGIHGVAFGGLRGIEEEPPQPKQRPVEVAVLIQPEPEPEPAPEPKKKPPPPPPAPKPVVIEQARPPDEPPPSNTTDAPADAEPPKPVFGISMSSTVGPGAGGFAVRVGNTLMKEPEKELTPAEDVKAYRAPVALHKVDRMPKRVGECEAAYPPDAKSMGIEGSVKLKLEIDPEGRVASVRVVKGLGYGLDEAAVSALRKCRFSPAISGGQPAATEITYTYRFVIDG